MQCNHCQSEWNTSAKFSQIDSCPFCGELFTTEIKFEEALSDVIKRILSQFGVDILCDKSRFLSIFSDISPNMKKEKRIISFALDEKIDRFFVDCLKSQQEEHLMMAYKVLSVILSEEAIILVINSLVSALNWEVTIFQKANAINGTQHVCVTEYYSHMQLGYLYYGMASCNFAPDNVVRKKNYAESLKWTCQ